MATGWHVMLPYHVAMANIITRFLHLMQSNVELVSTCWKLAVKAHSMCSYIAAVRLTRLTAEAAVNPA